MELRLMHSISFKFGSTRNYRRQSVFSYGEFTYTIRLSDGHFIIYNGVNYLPRSFVIDYISTHHHKNYSICHYVLFWDGTYILTSVLIHKAIKSVQLCLFD